MTIVERAQRTIQAEQSRLDRLFEDHVEAVYAYAARRTSAATAEDIASEVFSEVYKRPDRVPYDDPRPWLIGVARRKLADHLRRTSTRQEVGLSNDIHALQTSATGLLVAEEESQQLRQLVDRLPENQREALLLHYVEDLTAKQIAVVMRRSAFSINSLLQRARKRMAEQGRDYFEGNER